jgi:tRNA pseudouridine55 synthase
LEENQDELVSDRPASKRKTSTVGDDPTMSGGVNPPDMEQPPDETKTEEPTDAGPPAAMLRMTVTSGFYVRSLCHDLGEAVGSQAIMAQLTRTRQAQFELGNNVLEYSDLAKGEDVWAKGVEEMLDVWNANGNKMREAGSSVELKHELDEEDGVKVKAKELAA